MDLAAATAQLTAAGVATPRVDAELLLAHVLGVPRSRLVLVEAIPADAAAEFAALVRRRAERVPLQHLVGTAPFRHLDIAVGPGVFVPRPETELLVDAVLAEVRVGSVVVDLCAGSGAIGLAVAQEAPGSVVVAVELAPEALTWLRHNAAGSSVRVVRGDVTDAGLLTGLSGGVDVVVSNPPYVPAATEVAPEVRADPPGAVFAGADGLALIPAVLARAAQLLRPGGLLALEHDDTHARPVAQLAAAAGFGEIADHTDLTGRPRYLTARHCRTHR
jgi:release factor glutamine methyltransferase